MQCVMGIDGEYAVMCDGDSDALCPDVIAACLLAEAEKRFVSLPHAQSGLMLASGARFYIDSGGHPEWCTAECTGPDDLVAQVRAGETNLASLLRRVDPRIRLLRNTVSYGPRPSSWGSHESYGCRQADEALCSRLESHLITRMIITGAGGLDPHAGQARFALSPRSLAFLRRHQRLQPIPLCSLGRSSHAPEGWRRLHVNIGEHQCMDSALWLRVAATALLVRLLDEGRLGDKELPRIARPDRALRSICCDPSLTARVRMDDGRELTALDIQQMLCDQAQECISNGDGPTWAARACQLWRHMLDQLAAGPDAAAGDCDWAMKYIIFTRLLQKQGCHWHSDLPMRTGSVRHSQQRLSQLPLFGDDARRAGATTANLPVKLMELDLRFGMLPGGMISHAAGLGDVAGDRARLKRSRRWAPQDTRAAVRGRYIRRLARDRERYVCNWSSIYDCRRRRRLDLSEPFARDAHWIQVTPSTLRQRLRALRVPRSWFSCWRSVSQYFNGGNFRALRILLDSAFEAYGGRDQIVSVLLHYRAQLECQTGNVRAALDAARQLELLETGATASLRYLSIYRYYGLRPPSRVINHWLDACQRDGWQEWDGASRVNFLGHKGYALSRQERMTEAMESLETSLRIPLYELHHERLIARNRCDLADCYRIVGDADQALKQVELAEQAFARHLNPGGWAGQLLVLRAKLSTDPQEQHRLLHRAISMQRRLGNPVGLTRSALLLARMVDDPEVIASCRQIVEVHRNEVRDLRESSLLRRLCRHWQRWVHDRNATVLGDPYWLL